MAINPFIAAINQLTDEKNLPKEVVVEALEAAVAAAYRKEYGKPNQIIRVAIDPDTNKMKVWRVFEVVTEEEFEDAESQKLEAEASEINKDAKVGDKVEIELESKYEFGRIAAQTAKQVIIQRLREAERNILLEEFKEKQNQVLNATIQQIEGDNIIINLGRASGVMPAGEQIPNERYYIGQRLKVLIAAVEESQRGLHILLSRARAEFIETLFRAEVPEISNDTVIIKSIAREAGSRTKMAVISNEEGIDPVGSCVGQRGTRVQAVLAEIGDEKIDIILWHEDTEQFIVNALSPAKIESVNLDHKEHRATIQVASDQLSLAIGKSGQNVRLASKLTGWSIDIAKNDENSDNQPTEEEQVIPTADKKTESAEQTKPVVAKKTKAKKVKKTEDEATQADNAEPVEEDKSTDDTN